MQPTEEEIKKRQEYKRSRVMASMTPGQVEKMRWSTFGAFRSTYHILFGAVSLCSLGAIAYVFNDSYDKKGICLTCDAQAKVAAKMYGADPLAQFNQKSTRSVDFTQATRAEEEKKLMERTFTKS